ncbi:ABC transporter permease [Nitratidesulfovibrio sp. D1]|uniref:ABC transporter permease n=1 Tax=Nitratidesulfovibrio sp. D1 TaxID=3440151 RepID=UPI003EBFA9D2
MQIKDSNGILTTYSPNERQGGLIWAVRQALREIVLSREVITSLFLRDFTMQFRQKVFSYFWALFTPLLGIASFIFMYLIGILKPGVEDIPYPVYVLLGTSIWGCLTGAMAAVSRGLLAQADLIMRTNIPKLALAVSSLAGVAYSLLVGMASMGLVFWFYDFVPSWWFAAYPVLVLPMLILGSSLGLVLSVLGSIARDFTPLVTQVLGLAMYATPVIYVARNIGSPFVQMVIRWNPLTYLVEVPRDIICKGASPDLATFGIVSLGCLGGAVLALRIFYLIQDLVAERL